MKNNTMQEKEIYPAEIWANNEKGSKPYELYEKHKNDPIGTELYFEYGAPGVGHRVEEITRITPEGIYGIVIEDTGYVPGPKFFE